MVQNFQFYINVKHAQHTHTQYIYTHAHTCQHAHTHTHTQTHTLLVHFTILHMHSRISYFSHLQVHGHQELVKQS